MSLNDYNNCEESDEETQNDNESSQTSVNISDEENQEAIAMFRDNSSQGSPFPIAS